MSIKTAHAVMSLHRKQMADALTRKGKEDMLGFEWAAFQHRELMKMYAPTIYDLWATQNPERATEEGKRRGRQARLRIVAELPSGTLG